MAYSRNLVSCVTNATSTLIDCITILTTSGIFYRLVVTVTFCRNFPCFYITASFTSTTFQTLIKASRCLVYIPHLIIMTERRYFVSFIAVTASTLIGCVTLFTTSGICYCRFVTVTFCRNFPCFNITASFTSTTFQTLIKASRCLVYIPHLIIMTECRYFVSFIAVTASTLIGCITLFTTSGICYCCFVTMTFCGNFPCFNITASFTSTAFHAFIKTSRRFFYIPVVIIVTRSCYFILYFCCTAG